MRYLPISALLRPRWNSRALAHRNAKSGKYLYARGSTRRRLHRSMVAAWCALFIFTDISPATEPIDIGSRRELFVEHHLIGSLNSVRLVLHRPEPREILLRFDQPWKGLYSGHETVLKDGETYRFYYHGMPEAKHDLDTEITCVAESKNGSVCLTFTASSYSDHGGDQILCSRVNLVKQDRKR